jgi:hypothetical protein
VGSVCFGLLGVWAYLFHQSLSPVYTDVKCSLGKMDIKKMSFEGGFNVDLISKTVCVNPNPYAVELKSSKGVNVYMGKKKTLVSHIQDIAPTVLPPRGMGAIHVHVKSKPTSAMFGTIFGSLFSRQTPVWIENSIDLKIEINFYFMKVKLGTAFTKDCAMNVQLLRGSMAKLGAMTCGENFDDLEIPPVTGLPFKGELPLYDYHLADSEIKAGTLAKDVGLGTAMASGFGFGSLLFFWSFYCVYMFCQGKGAQSGDPVQPQRPRRRRREGREDPKETEAASERKESARGSKEKKEAKGDRTEPARDVKEKRKASKDKRKRECSRDHSAGASECEQKLEV